MKRREEQTIQTRLLGRDVDNESLPDWPIRLTGTEFQTDFLMSKYLELWNCKDYESANAVIRKMSNLEYEDPQYLGSSNVRRMLAKITPIAIQNTIDLQKMDEDEITTSAEILRFKAEWDAARSRVDDLTNQIRDNSDNDYESLKDENNALKHQYKNLQQQFQNQENT